MIPLLERADNFKERTALRSDSSSLSYGELLDTAHIVASQLLNGRADLYESRIAFLIPPSPEYTVVQWGIWNAGGIAVPLCVLHPLPSIQYVLEDTEAEYVIAHDNYYEFLQPLQESTAVKLLHLDSVLSGSGGALPEINPGRNAMILYTSGTTSKPKGVVTTHNNISSQIKTLVDAWEWEMDDHILNVLPLHHVHGIINVMSCALWVGACCEFLPKFDANKVWDIMASGRLSLFMAVPTIYFKLISYWDKASEEEQKQLSKAVSDLRLMVSGSAALPVPVLEKWQAITGHVLLERYGMTEIGMALSNSYRGERRPGYVGKPLPGVEIRLVDANGKEIPSGSPGEIQVKGPCVFKAYWRKEQATKEAFTEDGWFKTGDMAEFNDGIYKILGRNSVDIIKSGGYKISALQIEDVLRRHEEIEDCAVVGLPDEEWGEVIAACLISTKPSVDTDAITEWLKGELPGYQLPRKYVVREELPRNVLGKVTKQAVKQFF
ncbi:acyl-CoA synthetase [Poritiphilus flavus]|uniref:AMP-binding protein n=1 Tax=Poritiphilus flavus TaxID=2697053 RepID=A0A6L9E970_9FLAO|nr:acyl-CoA synthetase [Poritiphilus flavus]NAS11019.1 AMP-binding protein [Poritiphilus flavus]